MRLRASLVDFRAAAAAIDFSGAVTVDDLLRDALLENLHRSQLNPLEEAAAYLDGPGRDEARRLPRLSALAYANESMKLTTRMMQLASWLLVRRAVAEGEMSVESASAQIARLRLNKNEVPVSAAQIKGLPKRLIELIQQSIRLQDRVAHADTIIKTAADTEPVLSGRNAVALQHLLLRSAFARGEARP